MRKKERLVQGFGVNDADYPTEVVVGGKRVPCPYYRCWARMLERVFSPKYKQKRPSYSGVRVCGEWLSFMAFRSWMAQQSWQGKELDKDIIGQSKRIYSPETCAFVDRATNSFVTQKDSCNGGTPVGVNWHKKDRKFIAHCSNPFTGKKERLGAFNDPASAHHAWRRRKHELSCILADRQDDPRVAAALRERYLD